MIFQCVHIHHHDVCLSTEGRDYVVICFAVALAVCVVVIFAQSVLICKKQYFKQHRGKSSFICGEKHKPKYIVKMIYLLNKVN